MASAPLALLPPIVPSGSHSDCATVTGAPLLVCDDEGAVVVPEAVPEVALPAVEQDEEDNSTRLLAGLSSLLALRVTADSEADMPPWRRSCFHNKESSDAWSLSDYMAHIHWFFECSSPCLVIALIYLNRAVSDGAKLALSGETCHRLFLA